MLSNSSQPFHEDRYPRYQYLRSLSTLALAGTFLVIVAIVTLRENVTVPNDSAHKKGVLQTMAFHPFAKKAIESSLFTQLTNMDQIFSGPDQPNFLPIIVDQINSGNMKCCVRAGADIPPPAYSGAYGDWPKIICIPGYRLDSSLPAGQNCVMCDAGTYCPKRDANIYTCPSDLWSRPGSANLPDCWCSPGYYGTPGPKAR